MEPIHRFAANSTWQKAAEFLRPSGGIKQENDYPLELSATPLLQHHPR